MNMKKNVCLAFAATLSAIPLLALEVLVPTPEQEAFLKMTPAERRDVFTNESYRAKLAQHDWEKMTWRETGEEAASRWRHLPGVPNMRDLGGLKGLGGRTILTGRIYRSGGFNNNACRLYSEEDVMKMYREGTLLEKVPAASRPAAAKIKADLDAGKKTDTRHLVREWVPGKARLDAAGLAHQRNTYGIRTDLDLRTDRECFGMAGSPLGPQTKWVHSASSAYEGFHSESGRAATKRNFALFLDRANYPIAFHCIAGADRTGSLAYLLEALLGVSEADLVLDWELTAFHNPNHKFAHADRYDKLVEGFAQYPGTTARARAEGYVKSLGFTDDDIAKFRAIMLTPSVPVSRTVAMRPGELWWGAMNYYGTDMPFSDKTKLKMDIRRSNKSNQAASFLVSDQGRSIWCDDQVLVVINDGKITFTSDGAPIELDESGKTLKDAFLAAARRHFPSAGRTPDLLFFSAPQYNTWIELTYHQNEKDILNYAQSMLDNGLPPGVFMIDDTWQAGYGDWRFEPTRFADPKGMMDKLNAMGFKTILWVCPYVSMDSPAYRRIAWGFNPDDVKGYPTRGGFLGVKGGKINHYYRTVEPAAISWWNGKSAFLDLTHPNANAWFREQLDRLVRDYGAYGFKLDGGHFEKYADGYQTWLKGATCGEQVMAYAKYALEYPVTEYRNAWRFQGQPVVERLHDKAHTWEALRKLVPDMIAGGLLGHPFMCPDMIGGGSHTAFLPGAPFDPDLFVRSAQVHALCGMMQFSASPWRYLDKPRQQIIRDLVKMRQAKFANFFVELAKESGRTGEPMIRNLEYNYPKQGYAKIQDEFMMGTTLLVAPVVVKDAKTRTVVIPEGVWRADDGTEVTGPTEITVNTPLARLPYFVKKEIK